MHKLNLTSILIILTTMMSTALYAAPEKTIRLSVENMTCSTCPITVRFSLKQVNGVTFADMDTETAMIPFDPDKATIKMLTDATTNAGYPSKFKEEIKQ